MNPIRILLVDDQASVRRGLRMRLQLETDMAVVGEASDGATALASLPNLRPDVMVLDYEMPGLNGLDTLKALSDTQCGVCVVMLSIHDNDVIKREAARAGAFAFVAKQETGDRLLEAIRRAAASSRREAANDST
jgi:DNA-binding NarL/FixJ family response regulator